MLSTSLQAKRCQPCLLAEGTQRTSRHVVDIWDPRSDRPLVHQCAEHFAREQFDDAEGFREHIAFDCDCGHHVACDACEAALSEWLIGNVGDCDVLACYCEPCAVCHGDGRPDCPNGCF